jgi:hypothetical protein
MNTLIEVIHDLKTNTLTLIHADENNVRLSGRGYSPLQIDDFRAAAGEHAQRYIDLAGWTPEYIESVLQAELAEAKRKQDKADAEEAERKVKADKAEKEAFDAEVAKQVAILEAVQEIVAKKSKG